MAVQIYVDRVAFEPAEREEWMDLASCLQYDPEMFFPERGNTTYRTAQAKKICNEKCSVRLKCLAKALIDEAGTSRRTGVFGGMSPTEREQLQQQLDKMKEQVSA